MSDTTEFPRFTCPRCQQHTVLTVILGMPAPIVWEAEMRGEVLIGGCDVTGFEPSNPLRCTECDWEGALLDDGSIVSWPTFAPLDEILHRLERDTSDTADTFRRLVEAVLPDARHYGDWLLIDEVRPTLLSQRGEACWFADDGELVVEAPSEHPDFVDVATYWAYSLDDDDEDDVDEGLLEGSIGCLGSHFFRDRLEEGVYRYMGRCLSESDVERRVFNHDIRWNDSIEVALFGDDLGNN